MLRKELENRLEQKGFSVEWAEVISDLDNLVEMEMEVSGKRYMFRSQTAGTAANVKPMLKTWVCWLAAVEKRDTM